VDCYDDQQADLSDHANHGRKTASPAYPGQAWILWYEGTALGGVSGSMRSLWLLLLTCTQVLSAPLVLHVATNGNDAASGALTRQPGDGPMASLGAALRKIQAARPTNGATIFIHGGVYRLAAPLVLTPDLSGVSATQPLLITAFGKQQPILSGGVRLGGWREESPGLWSADARAQLGSNWMFRSLFINGRRAIRARTPNEGELLRMDGARFNDQPFQFKYRATDLNPAWVAPGDVEVVAFEKWTDVRQFLREVKVTEHRATLSGSSTVHTREADARYFVENAPDAIDQPGEWRLDRKTGVVKAKFAPKENPNDLEIVVPRLKELLEFRGDLAGQRAVHHVVLRGLTLADTDWTMGDDGYRDTQAAVAVRGDIFGDGMRECAIENCKLTRLGGYGIDLGRGCQGNRIVGNELVDLGAGGIRVGEATVRTNAFDATHGSVITDNHLHHLGRVYPPAVGVLILQSATNRVAHNAIHDLYYSAVSVGWTWGYRESPCHHNTIEFNHLYDVGQGLLSDMGAVYTLGPQPGTVVRNNLIHHVKSFTYGGWGLYTDEGSTGIVLENNIVHHCLSAGFHQHYGKENVIRNNIFAFNQQNQLMRSRDEAHTSFFFTNNIVVFASGQLLGSTWHNDKFVLERNLYWKSRAGLDAPSIGFAGANLAQWQARGHDTNSIVADPLFVDAARDDFQLRPASPALSLGFKPIDVGSIGPRPTR
jgi:parallel beta-helix repeat protein